MRKVLGALAIGYVAFALAVGVGIPVWADSPSWQVPADACDIGTLTALAVLLLTTPRKPKDTSHDG